MKCKTNFIRAGSFATTRAKLLTGSGFCKLAVGKVTGTAKPKIKFKMKFNYRFICLVLLILIINSCEKIELEKNNPNFEIYKQLKKSVNEHFFDYNYVTSFNFTLEEIYLRNLKPNEEQDSRLKSATDLYSPYIQEIREFYRVNPNKQKHIEKKYGFPMWDRLVEVKLDDGELAVIPVANEKSINIEAIIYVFKNERGKLKFHYAERGKFNKYPEVSEKVNGKKYPDREFVLSQFLYFDKTIFEYVDCEILNEYKELLGLNDDTLKSASSVVCTVTVEYTINKYYYAVYVGSTLVKFAYNYSEVIYDVDYYCTGSYSGTTGGGTSSGGDDGEGFDEIETVDGEIAQAPKPCPGDPVINPTIAPTAVSIEGGTYGNTRQYSDGQPKFHNGIDIAGNIGDPLYAMYDGIVTVAHNIDDNPYNGKYYRIESKVNRKTIQITMIHLNDLYFTEGSFVPQGAIIGEIGDTGNATEVPNKHVHITIKEKDENGNWIMVDPINYINTEFDSNWTPIPCN